MKERYIGRASRRVREFALYGETTGETDEFGLPVRYNWAAEYRGPAAVVYGHTPVPEAGLAQPHDQHRHRLRVRREADGAALAGAGARLRRRRGRRTRSRRGRSCRPSRDAGRSRPSSSTTTCSTSKTSSGKRIVTTRLHHNVTVREENAIAALEVMSRFAANPKWLIYLPPTMSPTETTRRAGLLEHPQRGVRLFPHAGRRRRSSAKRSTWARGRSWSSAATRTAALQAVRRPGRGHRHRLHPHRPAVLRRPRGRSGSCSASLHRRSRRPGFWDEFASDWFCLDCELMPWSAKAQDLLEEPVRRRRFGVAGGAGGRRSPCSSRQPIATVPMGATLVGRLLERQRDRLHGVQPVRRRVPALLLAGAFGRTT